MWSAGQTWMALVENVVWTTPSLDFFDQATNNEFEVVPKDDTLLALEDTATLIKGEHSYNSTRCLWVESGVVVYRITNVRVSTHSENYQRIDG